MDLRVDRLWGSLRFHVALLSCVLVGLLPVIGWHGLFQVDEGAALAQVAQLREHGTWFMPHGFPAADPDGLAFALDRSTHTDEGFAPLLKHPAYPLLLAAADTVGGRLGIALLGVAGTVVAAIAAALIGREIRPGIERWCLWVAGVSSPLLFDAYLVIAHTLGAAGFGLAALGAIRHRRRGGVGGLVLCAAGVGWVVLLRNEGMLAGCSLGVALIVTSFSAGATPAVRARHRTAGAVALVIASVAFAADRVVTQLLAPTLLPSTSSTLGDYSWIGGRINAFFITYVMPGYVRDPNRVTGTIIVAVFALFVGRLLRSRRTDQGLWILTAVLCWAGAVVWVVWAGRVVVPGILMAFPLLGVAIVTWHRPRRGGTVVPVLAGTVVLFALGVMVTQYAIGGGAEWGARYLAIALPLAAPLVVWSVAARLDRFDTSVRSLAMVCLVPIALAPAVVSVTALRASHAENVRRMNQISEAMQVTPAGDGGAPVVVSSVLPLPRFAWDQLDEGRWLAAEGDLLDEVVVRLDDLGVERFILLTSEDDIELGAGFDVSDCRNLGSESGTHHICTVTRSGSS